MKVWELRYLLSKFEPILDVECIDAGIIISKDGKQTHLIDVPLPSEINREVEDEKSS